MGRSAPTERAAICPTVADFASCPIASAVDGPFSWRRPEELGYGNILSVQPGDYSF
jgi:hypothetical protein